MGHVGNEIVWHIDFFVGSSPALDLVFTLSVDAV
jgi:hypothetical protein